MNYTQNNNNFVQSSTAEYGGAYGFTYFSITEEYMKKFIKSQTDDTLKKWTTTPHNYTKQNYKCLWNISEHSKKHKNIIEGNKLPQHLTKEIGGGGWNMKNTNPLLKWVKNGK